MTISSLPTGSAISHYVIVSELARDKSGFTYLAMDTTSVSGAEKVLVRETIAVDFAERNEDGMIEPLNDNAIIHVQNACEASRERARRLYQIDHSSVPEIKASLDVKGAHYTVFEHLTGDALQTLRRESGVFPSGQLRSILSLLVPGLEALHAVGLVHGSLSAEKIIRLDDGFPLITGLETAEVDGDVRVDVRDLGALCKTLLTGAGSVTDVQIAKGDRGLSSVIAGAIGASGKSTVEDMGTFARLLDKGDRGVMGSPARKVSAGAAACAAIGLAVSYANAAGSPEPSTNALVLEKVKITPGGTASIDTKNADEFELVAEDVSMRQLVTTATGVDQTLAQEEWLNTDRTDLIAIGSFLNTFGESSMGVIAREQIALLDERAWLEAQTAQTDSGFAAYIDQFGSGSDFEGLYVKDAMAARKAIALEQASLQTEARAGLEQIGYLIGENENEAKALNRHIRDFQKLNGLTVTGEITPEVLNAVNDAAAAVSNDQSNAMVSAPTFKAVDTAADVSVQAPAIELSDSNNIQPMTKPVPISAALKSINSAAAVPAISASAIPAKPKRPVRRPGDTFTDCEGCPTMKVLPAGSFAMGAPKNQKGALKSAQPVTRVTIAEPFAVGVMELTIGQYRAFLSDTGRRAPTNCAVESKRDAGVWSPQRARSVFSPGYSTSSAHPAACISWKDAQDYVSWLSKKTGETYRLLSESEWEYAVRGGSDARFFWGNNASLACRNANTADATAGDQHENWKTATCRDGAVAATKTGSYRANAFGLYDMTGNVAEWVEDCMMATHAGRPQNASARTNGTCKTRVIRGGSWASDVTSLGSAHREGDLSNARYNIVGFRVARDIK